MRRIASAVSVLALVMWFSAVTSAQPAKSARGTVTSVAGDTLTVRVGTNEMKFTVDAKTRIIAEGGTTATRAAEAQGKAGPSLTQVVKAGQSVEVSYHEMGATLHAVEVRRVSTPGAGGGSTSEQRDAARSQTATGTVDSITATTLSISGSGSGGANSKQSFTLDAKTRLVGEGIGTAAKAAGGKVSFTDHVGKGDRVTVTYRTAGGTLHAEEVRINQKAK